jgi:hypothetical protein
MWNLPETSENPPAVRKKLRIASAQELFEALRAPQMARRLSVLAAIGKNPAKAMSYGPYQGRDLFEELRTQLTEVRDLGYRRALVTVFSVLPDSRAREILEQSFARFDDAPTVLSCANRLAEGSEEKVKTFFRPFLEREKRPLQTRLAANILAKFGDDSPETQMKLALWADREFPPPPWNALPAEAWISPLRSPSAFRLRRLAERIGLDAFLFFRESFAILPREAQEWLIQWGSASFPDQATELLNEALSKDELVLTALEAIGRSPHLSASFELAATLLLKSADPKICLAALEAGAKPSDPAQALAEEQDVSIRCFLILNLFRWIEHPADILIPYLMVSDWHLRAAAAQALKALDHLPGEALPLLLEHERPEVRAAVMQVLCIKPEN